MRKRSIFSLTLLRRVVVAFLLLVVLPVVALLASQNAYVRMEMEDQLIDNAKLVVDHYNAQLQSRLNSASFVITQIVTNSDVRRVVRDSEKRTLNGETFLSLNRIPEQVNDLMISSGLGIRALALTNTRGIIRQIFHTRYATLPSTLTDERWYQEAMAARGTIAWQGLSKVGGVQALSASCAVFESVGWTIVGTINIAFTAQSLFELASYGDYEVFFHHPELNETYVSSGVGDGLASALPALLGRLRQDTGSGHFSAKIGGEAYLLVHSAPAQSGWITVYAIPHQELFASVRNMTMLIVAVLAVCFASLMVFLLRMNAKLLSPLTAAMDFINENTGHTVSIRHDHQGYPELTAMRQRVASLVEGKHSIEETLSRVSIQKDMNQLKQLQLQINPHFLYNTLNSIKILADTGRTGEVSRLIYDLVHLLNACMDKSGLFISVQKEAETLKRYLSIQQAIYGDRIRFEIDLDDQLKDCQVPNFILQPIVENALQHGLDQSRLDNYVRVSNRAEENKLVFAIEDNGIGMDEEKLRKIQRDMTSETPVMNIGLRSVHRRIQLGCGQAYGITIHSMPGRGSRLEIWLPRVDASEGLAQRGKDPTDTNGPSLPST